MNTKGFPLPYLFIQLFSYTSIESWIPILFYGVLSISIIIYFDAQIVSFWPPIVVVQSLSYVWLFATPWTAACQASLSSTISRSLLKLMSIESVMPSNHLILCHPFICLPSIFPSIRVFSNELVLCNRYWSFSFSINPSNEYSLGVPSSSFWHVPFICKDFLSFWYNRCSWFSLYFPSLNPEWRDSLILETYVLQFWQVFLELFFDNFFPFFWSYFLKFLFVRYLAFIWSCNFLSR